MIKRYDRETHSEFIKKFRKLFNPQKWDKIVKDNAETYIKHGKFQKEFISGTALTFFVSIMTAPFILYLKIILASTILVLLDVMLFIVTIAFPLACHYLLNREVQFKKEVRKIFGKETEHVLGKGSAGHSSIYQKTLSFIQEVNRQDIPEDMREEALYLRMRHYIEAEYPQSVRERKKERERKLENYSRYISEFLPAELDLRKGSER